MQFASMIRIETHAAHVAYVQEKFRIRKSKNNQTPLYPNLIPALFLMSFPNIKLLYIINQFISVHIAIIKIIIIMLIIKIKHSMEIYTGERIRTLI